jgi:hemolysin activation/secretion protein
VLKGLVFLPHVRDVVKKGVSTAGVDTSAVKFLDQDFHDKMDRYIDHPLTMADLNDITHFVVAYYRAHNHPLVDVVAPAQDVQYGVIQIAVTEFKVGQVRAEGNRWFSDSIITGPVTLKHGDSIDSERLINQLDQANTNPFRRVNLVYEPSQQPGFTDLVLQTQDRVPVRVFTGFDNSGTAATGRNRWEMGVTWGNALWHDQQLSYQFSSSPSFFTGNGANGALFQGHSLTWSIPVRGRDSITIAGNYARSVPNVGSDFGLVGESGGASIRYNLALRRTGSLIHTLSVGYDFKTTNNNLQFGGTEVSRTNAEIDQAPVTYAANMTDKWGSSQLNTTVNFSPGNITPNNTSDAFRPGDGQSGRPLASARYIYWRSDATRLTKLPVGAVWALRFIGQTSTSNLLYTEQLAGGGQEILRGYDPNAILGDKGVVISNELRSPALRKPGAESMRWLGNVQVLGFWDWGHLSAAHPIADAINHVNASSAGIGLRYNLRANVAAKMDYGWQLQHLPGTGARDHLLSFGFVTSY